jgi:cytochrome P450
LSTTPKAVKRVLLDNAQNYTKTFIARRLLEPGLGKGLITMEGEEWRRHRWRPPSIIRASSRTHQS